MRDLMGIAGDKRAARVRPVADALTSGIPSPASPNQFLFGADVPSCGVSGEVFFANSLVT
jgi:hypothetical protein